MSNTTTTSDLLDMIEKLRHDESLSAREALSQLATDLKRRADDGYIGDYYRTDYIVEGRDNFPVDMLRYTQSWPADEESTHAIQHSITDHRLIDDTPIYRVKLTKYHRDPKPQLAEARWASKFRWKVVEVLDTVQD